MREIKFDAIYKPTGEHFVPKTLDFNNNILTGDFDLRVNDWCHFSLDGENGDAIIREYTGVTDKNGSPIYEGDIVKNIRHNQLLKVTWQEPVETTSVDGVRWMIEKPGFRFEKMGSRMAYVYNSDALEVIGNIHENPELLEVEVDA